MSPITTRRENLRRCLFLCVYVNIFQTVNVSHSLNRLCCLHRATTMLPGNTQLIMMAAMMAMFVTLKARPHQPSFDVVPQGSLAGQPNVTRRNVSVNSGVHNSPIDSSVQVYSSMSLLILKKNTRARLLASFITAFLM